MKSKFLFIGGLFIIALIMLIGSFAGLHGKINLHDELQVLFILASIFYTIYHIDNQQIKRSTSLGNGAFQ